MRALVIAGLVAALAAVACSPKGANTPHAPDDDLDLRDSDAPAAAAAAATSPAAAAPRAVAPAAKGARSGTIARDRLLTVLDAGPGNFLRQLEVTPRLSGDQFVGWQLVQVIDPAGPLTGVDVIPGDVLLAVNGKPVSRPEQLQTLWDSLRTANEVTAQLWRGDQQLELKFTVEPAIR